jgi:NAD(P)-dependent dehydrogenase (short-subunit alcohol dehydrogenase family)
MCSTPDKKQQRVAWVAGVGARDGLGAAVAQRFARAGLAVVVTGRTPARVEAVAIDIRSTGGVAKSGLRSLAQTFAREFGPQGIHVAHVVIDGGIELNAGAAPRRPTSS